MPPDVSSQVRDASADEAATSSTTGEDAGVTTRRHWVRLTTACNNRCLFCLDSETPRDVLLSAEELKREIDRGRDELGASRLILSGGEATVHPAFVELVRYGRERGYERVQLITNGQRLARRDFFDACMDAGLGEITFSVHGHDAQLHDRLTGTPGSYEKLTKALMRALRDGRPIVNVDIVINKQNVAVLPKIVEKCIALGVHEFDLLHVIPQGRAFDNREELFYDVREHLPTLQQVFRLGRHPHFTVWTNRFPVSFLEGLEDLIQDPHKLLDEINGRRFAIRRYLDLGEPLDCREPERCRHCFVEPFCTTMDRVVARQHRRHWQIWWLGDQPLDGEPPFGCSLVGLRRRRLEDALEVDLPPATGLYLELEEASSLPVDVAGGRSLVLFARSPQQLDAWLAAELPARVELDVLLDRDTAPWLLSQRERLATTIDRVVLRQPSHEQLDDADHDVADLPAFFRELALPVSVSGLPACLAPGARLVEQRAILPRELFDPASGRLDVRALGRYHIGAHYCAKSVRCADCVLDSSCEGAHINLVRSRGLAVLQPLRSEGQAGKAPQLGASEVPARLADGRAPELPAPSLPGYAMPEEAPLDPLAVIALGRARARAMGEG